MAMMLDFDLDQMLNYAADYGDYRARAERKKLLGETVERTREEAFSPLEKLAREINDRLIECGKWTSSKPGW